MKNYTRNYDWNIFIEEDGREDCSYSIKFFQLVIHPIFKSSHLKVFLEKSVLKSNFIEIAHRHGCSPVNLLYIFITPFTKNASGRLVLYIYDLLPSIRSSRRHVNSFNMVSCKSEYFKNSFIPNLINEWNKLDPCIRSSTSYNLFRNTLLKLISPVQIILLININNYKTLMIH